MLLSLIPIIGVISVGAIARNIEIFNEHHTKGFEIFLFKIGFPCYLFSVALTQDLDSIFNIRFIAGYIITFICAFSLAMLLHKNTPLKQQIALSLTSSYCNTSSYLTPVLLFLFNNVISGVIANLLQVIIIQSIVILIFTSLNNSKTSKLLTLCKVACTPFIIMPLCGLALNYFSLQNIIKYPYEIINTIGKSTAGMALFVFGLNCAPIKFHDNIQKLKVIKIITIKNFIHPLIAFCVGYFLLNLHGYWLQSLVIAASAPTAFLIYIISNQYNAQDDAIKIGVILSSVTSVITIVFISIIFSI